MKKILVEKRIKIYEFFITVVVELFMQFISSVRIAGECKSMNRFVILEISFKNLSDYN